jgi:hypothetical protein
MIPKGLVDMWVNPQITISRLLKDTYDIKTVFPYTNERQAHFPGAEIEIFPDPDEQVPSFVAHEILGRMVSALSSVITRHVAEGFRADKFPRTRD